MNKEWTPSQHDEQGGRLEKRVARGLTWTLVDTWGSQVLGLVVFAVLTRLLSPEDFGLVALAAVFVALGQVFIDAGLGDAVIQRASLTRRQINTAFVSAVLIGSGLCLATILLAPFIARILGDDRLTPILQALSLIFIVIAFNSIQVGILRREMNFRGLALRRLVATGLGGMVGIAMALNGYGAWSLVGQQLSAAFISVLVLWRASPWRPGLSFSAADFRSLFGFGANVVASDLLGFVSRNSDNLLIGVFLGPVALGFYAVAYRILDTSQTILVSAARRLVFPAFSRLQHDFGRVRRAYLRLSRTSGTLTLPGYIGLALVAPQAIVVLFGQKWEPSGTTAAILFLIGPALTIQAFSGAVWNAVGHPEVTLRFRLIATVTNVVGFIIAVAYFQNIVAVAAAYTIRGYALLPLNLHWMRVYGGVPVREQLGQLRGVALSTTVMALAVIAVKLALGESVHNFVLLAAEVLVGMVVFAGALFLIERPLFLDVASIAAQAIPGGERIAALLRIQVHRPPPVHVSPVTNPPVSEEPEEA